MDGKRQMLGVTGDRGRPRRRADREPAARAPLIEIFASVQGEGRHVGLPMVFVRTATCPLRCLYCDTTDSYEAPVRFPILFDGRASREPNPVTGARAAELVGLVARARHGGVPLTVSLTGGEPLQFPEFVSAFGLALREQGGRLHLETAAIDPDALDRCVAQIDHLSADFKLPSTLGAPVGGPAADVHGGYGAAHRRCVELALRRGASVDVKVVLTPTVTEPEFGRALEELEPVRSRIQLVLQPVTPCGAVRLQLAPADLERHLAAAARAGFHARALPQVHRILRLP